jgi:hypothetical protein
VAFDRALMLLIASTGRVRALRTPCCLSLCGRTAAVTAHPAIPALFLSST